MSANDYHLVSQWRVLGTVEECYDIISAAEDTPRWWPAAFSEVLTIEKGDETGLGTIVRMKTQGYLPYTLNWHLRVTDVIPNTSISFKVWGDFEGEGQWTFTQNDAWCDIGYDWRITVKKGIVRYLSFLGRPVFVSNHRWAMARGEESLRIELARRHAPSDVARASLPEPPQPKPVSLAVPAAIGASLLALLFLRGRRRDRDAS
ncbi:MAG: polyketide cyclase [Dehalococcoidia bacterium]